MELSPFAFLLSPFTFLLSPFSFLLSPFSFLLSPFSFLLSPSNYPSRSQNYKLPSGANYSYLKASTGFLEAALQLCQLTVRTAMRSDIAPAETKIHQLRAVFTAND